MNKRCIALAILLSLAAVVVSAAAYADPLYVQVRNCTPEGTESPKPYDQAKYEPAYGNNAEYGDEFVADRFMNLWFSYAVADLADAQAAIDETNRVEVCWADASATGWPRCPYSQYGWEDWAIWDRAAGIGAPDAAPVVEKVEQLGSTHGNRHTSFPFDWRNPAYAGGFFWLRVNGSDSPTTDDLLVELQHTLPQSGFCPIPSQLFPGNRSGGPAVIPAKAGIQQWRSPVQPPRWIPAFAGMT